jgi:hypothetical protein
LIAVNIKLGPSLMIFSPLPVNPSVRLSVCLSVCPSVTKISGIFSAMCAATALKLFTWLYNYDLQIKIEDGCYQPIFRRVMPLEELYIFPDFFLSAYRYSFDIWFIAFAIQRYRSSLSLVLIHSFFTKLWPLDLEEKNIELSVLRTFFFAYSFDIWYIAF